MENIIFFRWRNHLRLVSTLFYIAFFWQLKEATLFALVSVSDQLLEAEVYCFLSFYFGFLGSPFFFFFRVFL